MSGTVTINGQPQPSDLVARNLCEIIVRNIRGDYCRYVARELLDGRQYWDGDKLTLEYTQHVVFVGGPIVRDPALATRWQRLRAALRALRPAIRR